MAALGRLSAPWETVAARSAETLASLSGRGFGGRVLLADGRPYHESGASEAQELAAIIECTDIEFLPPSKQDKLTKLGGREKLQERLTAIKQILEER